VTSVSWIKEGGYLAVGTNNAELQIWDAETSKKLRTIRNHQARIGSISWNEHVVSSGSRDGSIHNNDVRVAQSLVSRFQKHTQEVCGLKWSPDGTQLASGGNDNLLAIWDPRFSSTDPRFTLTHHTAAVKALAWCPWQNGLLATGGGTNDRHIRFWNTQDGSCVNSIDTQSQVCSIVWSKEYKELVSSHGFAHNQLIVWKYPTLTKVAELTGHTSRVLHMAISPDGQQVASAASDETIRVWKCFETTAQPKKASSSSAASAKFASKASQGMATSLSIR
jgi:cell division cycle protein 20 (cofactor of APC complex)